jgi:hypothetical protein
MSFLSQFNPHKNRAACVLALAAMLLFGGLQALEAGHYHGADDAFEQCLLCKNLGESHAAVQRIPTQFFATANATSLAVASVSASSRYLNLQPRAPPFYS